MEEETQRVLVTGASGFLGGRLASALLQLRRYRVRLLVRRISSVSSDFDVSDPLLEIVEGDVLEPQSLVSACQGCITVFHVAAFVKSWAPNPSRFFEVNVAGLQNVIQAVKSSSSVTKLVYTSSFFALGPTKEGQVADEHKAHSGRDFCTEYEKSKVQADSVALRAASEGVPIVLLYPGVIYGPGKLTRGNIIADIIIERFNWRLPGYIGFGHDRFSFCHVDDVAAGHIAAMEKGVAGERYILGGDNKSLKDVFDIAAAITSTSKPWFCIPLSVVYFYGYLSTVFSRITGAEPVVTHPAVSVIKKQWSYSSAKAENELGYKPRPLDEGLAEILAYLKQKKLINY